MYRVSGAGGYRFKPPQTSGSWTGGPLVESETSDSYLGHPSGGTESGAGSFRYSRSPVCRLLEQTQYVATPTEDEHRPRPPTGPPAFTSPAYFLPALAWLRLPLLRHSWPGEPNGAARDTTRYNAAQPAQCDCGGGETTHHWRPESWVESRGSGDNDPEYSEILEGGHSHYSSLNPTQPPPPPLASTNGIGPYEYEMQERSNNNNNNNNAGQARRQPYPLPPQRRNTQVSGHEHRYEKLWAGGGEADSGGLAPGDLLPPPNTPGTCENGWLSRYRLPSPIFPATDPPCRRHVNHLDHADCGATADDLTSDSELLPCDSVTVVPSDLGRRDRRSFSSNGRSEVKYPNPVYEGCGRRLQGPPAQVPSPLLSRLLGYISWNKR
ncbi:hypothetical protein ACOMHN_040524 [Nucella lapillus]